MRSTTARPGIAGGRAHTPIRKTCNTEKRLYPYLQKKAKPLRRVHANAHICFYVLTEIRLSTKPPKRMDADTQNRIDDNTVLRKGGAPGQRLDVALAARPNEGVPAVLPLDQATIDGGLTGVGNYSLVYKVNSE
jgi:hypothetical protein